MAETMKVSVAEAMESSRALSAFVRAPDIKVGAFGNFSATGTTTVTVTTAGAPELGETLTNEFAVQMTANGDFHLVDNNSADYGREVTSLGDTLYLRPRYGKWHQRLAQPGEANELIGSILAGFGEHLDLIAGGVVVKGATATTSAGRAAHKLQIEKAATTQNPPQSLTQRKGRESIAVTQATGDMTIDDTTGLVLDGKLAATLTFSRDGKLVTMTIAAKQQLGQGEVTPLAPPPAADVVQTPTRARDVDDAKTLLKGL